MFIYIIKKYFVDNNIEAVHCGDILDGMRTKDSNQPEADESLTQKEKIMYKVNNNK